MRLRHPLIAAVAVLALACGSVAAAAAVVAAKFTPVCTTSSNACEDRRIAAAESSLATLAAARTTATTAPTTTVKPTTTAPTTTAPTTAPTTTTPPASGFPDSMNTGPGSTVLTAYTGSCNLAAGTVLDAKVFNCPVEVMGAGVKITHSRINGIVQSDHSDTGRGSASVTISDSYIDGGQQEEFPTVSYDSVTLLRDEVVGGQHSVQCNSDCSITDSYLHGQYLPSTSAGHVNAFISNGGSGFTLEHDTLWCSVSQTPNDGGCSGDASLFGDFAPIANVTVDRNLFHSTGGSFCFFGGNEPSKSYPTPTNVSVTNNTFQRGSNQKCGYYGPVTSDQKDSPFTGNVFDDGTPVPQ